MEASSRKSPTLPQPKQQTDTSYFDRVYNYDANSDRPVTKKPYSAIHQEQQIPVSSTSYDVTDDFIVTKKPHSAAPEATDSGQSDTL